MSKADEDRYWYWERAYSQQDSLCARLQERRADLFRQAEELHAQIGEVTRQLHAAGGELASLKMQMPKPPPRKREAKP